MKVFKISGTVHFMEEHYCDCEYCEQGGNVRKSDRVHAAVCADTLTHARAIVIHENFLEDVHSFDWTDTTVEEIDIPDGKTFLISGRILTGDGYTSDGIIALRSDVVCGTFSQMIGEDKDGVSIAAVVDRSPPIDESPLQKSKSDGRYLEFSDGGSFRVTVDRKYVQTVEQIEAELHKTGTDHMRPLAIVKNGQHIGLLMPMRRW